MTSPELFENEREANLQSTIAMVEEVLIELGHVAAEARRAVRGAARAWAIHKGSATVDIGLLDREEKWWLRLQATLATLTEKSDRTRLFPYLLELNASAVPGAAFALIGDFVVLVAERSTVDLDKTEVHEMVERVQTAADHYDDKIAARFSAILGRSPAKSAAGDG